MTARYWLVLLCLVSSTEFSRGGEDDAVTRGACRQRSRRGKGEDDNGGETGREAGCLLGNNSSSVTRSSSQT